MRLSYILLYVVVTGSASVAQLTPPASASAQPPSSLVQPALDSVARAGSGVDLNRWKGSAAARDEVDGNLASMQKDLQTTLPTLLAAADAAPGSASASLPLLLNLDALYSVLLRVTIASRSSAPRNETAALEQATTQLDSARRDLGNAVLASAKASEQRASDLQAAQQQPAAQQQTPAAKTPAPAKSKKKAVSGTTRR